MNVMPTASLALQGKRRREADPSIQLFSVPHPMSEPDLRCRFLVVEPRQHACVQSYEVSSELSELRRVWIKRRADRDVSDVDNELQPFKAERRYLQALLIQFRLKPDGIDLQHARNSSLKIETRPKAANPGVARSRPAESGKISVCGRNI